MKVTANLLSAYGWFAGLLVVMIFITLLFGVIVFIALRPIKKETRGTNASTKKLLSRREAEITIELMNNKEVDKKTKEDLIDKLRRVKAAEEVVDELVQEEKAVADELDAEDAKRAKKPPKTRPAGQRPNSGAKPPKTAPAKKSSKDFKPKIDLDRPEENKAESVKAQEAKTEEAEGAEKPTEDNK